MNYQKIYNQIIERAQKENRKKKQGTYYEGHHIVPRCLGGEGTAQQWRTHPNIVLLTAREHYLCHWILARLYPENESLALAFWMISSMKNSNQPTRYVPSSRAYEEARESCSKAISKRQAGKVKTQEHRAKIAKTLTGYKHSEEVNRKKGRKGVLNKLYGKPTKNQFLTGGKNPQAKALIDPISGAQFETCTQAATYYNVSRNTITEFLKKGKLLQK